MQKLKQIVANPSGFDSASNFTGTYPTEEWLFVVAENRDSDTLTRSNFRSALNELGGESKNVRVFDYGHWACGWIKYLGVKENTPQAKIASELLKRLEGYPVVNEEDWSQLEDEEAQQVWKNCYDEKERIEYIRRFRNQFDFRSLKEVFDVVRGEYFTGYASELLG